MVHILLTQNESDVFAGEKPGQKLGGGVEDAGEPEIVRVANQVLERPHCDRGEVDDREGRVVAPRPHDVAGERVVCELPLAVQEWVTIEMDVPVVAGGQKVKDAIQIILEYIRH